MRARERPARGRLSETERKTRPARVRARERGKLDKREAGQRASWWVRTWECVERMFKCIIMLLLSYSVLFYFIFCLSNVIQYFQCTLLYFVLKDTSMLGSSSNFTLQDCKEHVLLNKCICMIRGVSYSVQNRIGSRTDEDRTGLARTGSFRSGTWSKEFPCSVFSPISVWTGGPNKMGGTAVPLSTG